jgi:hypothetical protein
MASPAERWTEAWFRAWTEHEPELLAPVYVAGPVQRPSPFRDLDEPQRYAAWAFSDEVSAEVWFAEPRADACEWWAISRTEDGAVVTLAGVSLLRFDDDGRCVDQRDYWSEREGELEPPDGWAPVAFHGSYERPG